MRKRIVIFLSFLVILMLACGLATNTGTGTTPQKKPGNIFANPTASPTIDPNPVSINDGLGSLNSYQLTVMFKSTGPDPTQSSTITEVTQRSRDTDAAYTQFNMSIVKKGGGDPSNTDTSIYTIGNDQCSGSTDSWTWTSNTPAQKEMEDLIKNMIGMTPMIDNPTFVAQETVNDIPSNHFSFKVSGLGAKSGAVVNINQGDYWLAVDGQYIVRYTLILETSTAANSEVLHEEVSVDVNHINQPVDISFPKGCLDASKVTPTP
jgi:hypothetical protein